MNRQEQIQTILNNFDFEHVRNFICQRPDKWWRGSDKWRHVASDDIPTVDELKEFARGLLENAAEPTPYNCNSIACGGFLALRWPWEGKIGTDCTMQLIFSAEDFEA